MNQLRNDLLCLCIPDSDSIVLPLLDILEAGKVSLELDGGSISSNEVFDQASRTVGF